MPDVSRNRHSKGKGKRGIKRRIGKENIGGKKVLRARENIEVECEREIEEEKNEKK